MKALAAFLLLSTVAWCQLPDAPMPQKAPVYPYQHQYKLQLSVVPKFRFNFDPIRTLEHSHSPVTRTIGRVWRFQDKHFDPNASMKGPVHYGPIVRSHR